MTFSDMMKQTGRAAPLLAAIKALRLPGRMKGGARVWTPVEAERLIAWTKQS